MHTVAAAAFILYRCNFLHFCHYLPLDLAPANCWRKEKKQTAHCDKVFVGFPLLTSIKLKPNLWVFKVKLTKLIIQGYILWIGDKQFFPPTFNQWIIFLFIVCLFVSQINILRAYTSTVAIHCVYLIGTPQGEVIVFSNRILWTNLKPALLWQNPVRHLQVWKCLCLARQYNSSFSLVEWHLVPPCGQTSRFNTSSEVMKSTLPFISMCVPVPARRSC